MNSAGVAAASLPERSLRNSPFLTNYYQFVKLLSENRFSGPSCRLWMQSYDKYLYDATACKSLI